MTETKKRTDFTPQTFKKALAILDLFTMENPELTAKELGYLSHLNTSSLYRYLTIMEESGYLYKNPETGRYFIGLRLVELGGIAMCRMDFRRHGQPALDRISSELKMNANMGVLYKGDLLHIAFSVWISGEPNYSVIGRRTPATCTAMGKLLLSSLEIGKVHDIINQYGWRPKTRHSIRNFKELDAELQKIRREGYSVDNQENGEEYCCLSFPVLDQQGSVVAAISATTTLERFTPEFQKILQCVKKNAEQATYHMGYYGKYPVINVRPFEGYQ
ncbi:MAG: IclR family transcriptional regulator [Treponema sp.]|jgi:DNA-binding IclR family transcriptional regulator|nr:IclR family transcriptional regulator [Treponema sp.]